MLTTAERIEGGLLGLLVADAAGVAYEFHPPERIPSAAQIEMIPPPGYDRAHVGTPPGTWSDDGAQALCLLASLLDCSRLDPGNLARRLIRWRDRGYMAVDGRVFDVGIQTDRAINRLARGIPPLEAGPAGVNDNGNGSLMRVLPLALWHRGDDADLVGDAHNQSRLTHGHPRAQACCAFYCLWARRTLDGHADAWAAAAAALRAVYAAPGLAAHRAELEETIRPDAILPPLGKGYVLDTLHSARWAMGQGDYEQVIKAAISLGHDTDTTAAVAGGIAGIRDGIGGIPRRWLDALRGRELVDSLLARLLDHRAATRLP